MTIKFTYIENEDDVCYEDFFIEFVDINEIKVTDTYYFDSMLEHDTSGLEIKEYLTNYINDWKVALLNMEEKQYCVIPIDLSDQYIGVLEIKFNSNEYVVNYGIVLEGALGPSVELQPTVYAENYIQPYEIIHKEISFTMTKDDILKSFVLN